MCLKDTILQFEDCRHLVHSVSSVSKKVNKSAKLVPMQMAVSGVCRERVGQRSHRGARPVCEPIIFLAENRQKPVAHCARASGVDNRLFCSSPSRTAHRLS